MLTFNTEHDFILKTINNLIIILSFNKIDLFLIKIAENKLKP